MIITQVRCYLFKRIMLETLVIITINIILRLIIVYTQTQVCPFCLFPYVFLQSEVTLRPSILCVTQKRAFMPLYIVLGQ